MTELSIFNPLAALAFRSGTLGDHRRIFGDWLNSYASSAFAKFMTPPDEWRKKGAARVYWDGQHDLIERLLVRPGSELVVACWPEDPTSIVGWICAEPVRRVLHYVDVKVDFRRAKVAQRLIQRVGFLDGSPVTFTHRSRVCAELPIPPNWKFDPWPALLEGP